MMKHLSMMLTYATMCLLMLSFANQTSAQSSLSSLNGDWKLNGSYPNGPFYSKWRIQATDQSIDIYEWQAINAYQKSWVRLSLEDASFDGYTLRFKVNKNLAGSWLTESYTLNVKYGNRLSGSILVDDKFIDDAQLQNTESLLGMDLGLSSSYNGSFTLVRQ